MLYFLFVIMLVVVNLAVSIMCGYFYLSSKLKNETINRSRKEHDDEIERFVNIINNLNEEKITNNRRYH